MELFDELIRQWLVKNSDPAKLTLKVNELCPLYLEHAEKYYRHPDGTVTGESASIRYALRYLIGVAGREQARDFGPLKLKDARELMIRAGG